MAGNHHLDSMKILTKTPIKGDLPDAAKVPCDLIVKNGRIVTLDGDTPIFDLPDGTPVNVINQGGLKKILKLAEKAGKKKSPARKPARRRPAKTASR